jgi:hypothetical protein
MLEQKEEEERGGGGVNVVSTKYLLGLLMQVVLEWPEGGEEGGVRAVAHEEREWLHCHPGSSSVCFWCARRGKKARGKSYEGVREIYIGKRNNGRVFRFWGKWENMVYGRATKIGD